MTVSDVDRDTQLDQVRGRRAALHRAMVGLEEANAHPADDLWSKRMLSALELTTEVLTNHVRIVEAPDGLFVEVARDAPHTLPRVERLRHEHDDLTARTMGLLETCRAGVKADQLREGVLALVTALARHRHAGADLLYEAYQVDISAAD